MTHLIKSNKDQIHRTRKCGWMGVDDETTPTPQEERKVKRLDVCERRTYNFLWMYD